MSKENCYEVYICKVDGEIVYIGSGKHGRHKHCTSGCSHVYELNKMHFLANDTIVVTGNHVTTRVFSDRKESNRNTQA